MGILQIYTLTLQMITTMTTASELLLSLLLTQPPLLSLSFSLFCFSISPLWLLY